jgi:hypothetical protein
MVFFLKMTLQRYSLAVEDKLQNGLRVIIVIDNFFTVQLVYKVYDIDPFCTAPNGSLASIEVD